MTQLSSRSSASPARQALPGLPRTGLTPVQQLEALERVQNQAEQRVRLGLQLFKAAEAHTSSHQQLLEDIAAEREKYRDETSKDIARSLHAFDQWIGEIDDTFTQAFMRLEERVDSVEQKLTGQQKHLEQMVSQTQKMLDQATALLGGQDIAPTVQTVQAVQTTQENKQAASSSAARPLKSVSANTAPSVKKSAAVNVDERSEVVTTNIQSFIKPVPPVKLAEVQQPAESKDAAKHTEPKQAPVNESDDADNQGPICQTVSYADILDRIYASRQQIKQDK